MSGSRPGPAPRPFCNHIEEVAREPPAFADCSRKTGTQRPDLPGFSILSLASLRVGPPTRREIVSVGK